MEQVREAAVEEAFYIFYGFDSIVAHAAFGWSVS
jgi:hypothetical protein